MEREVIHIIPKNLLINNFDLMVSFLNGKLIISISYLPNGKSKDFIIDKDMNIETI